MLRGAVHVHSTYSDGRFTLRELRDTFLAAGCSFLCMTDHAEYFDAARLRTYFDECCALSDAQFRFIPGLEYSCARDMHVLGYGASRLADSKDPQEVIAQIQGEGAIAVIAHPKDDAFPWIESLATLPDGVEAWNTKYDGRHAPRPGTFALIERLRQRQPRLLAFYGLDLHWKQQFRGLHIHVPCTENDSAKILAALSAGDFSARKSELELPSSGALSQQVIDDFARIRQRTRRWYDLARQTRKALAHLGIRIPEAVKGPLRRIF